MQTFQVGPISPLFRDIIRRQAAADVERPEGLHLSQIVGDIQRLLYPEDYALPQSDDGQRETFFELGSAIEDLLAESLAKRAGWTKPAPRTLDGVTCSPDGHNPASRTIDEIKACWKSANGFQHSGKWQGYVMQGLAYCKVFGAERLRLHIVFMNGDWRPPLPWPPLTYIVRPTQAEIEQNWRTLIQHARDREWL